MLVRSEATLNPVSRPATWGVVPARPQPAPAAPVNRRKTSRTRLTHEPELIGFLDDILADRLGPAGDAAERAERDPGSAALMLRRGFLVEGFVKF